MRPTELFYGKEGSIKMQKLKDGLAQIEKKHSEYFENREPKYSFEDCDRLHNHYSMTTNSIGVNFSFYANSDLDDDIKAECKELFKEIFNS